jgi:hypothetical protein
LKSTKNCWLLRQLPVLLAIEPGQVQSRQKSH